MVNYSPISKTNYFKVKDIDKLKEIVDSISCEDVEIWSGGNNTYAFGAYGTISLYYDEKEDKELEVYKRIQEILPDREFCIITKIDREELKGLDASCTIITNKEIKHVGLEETATKIAKKMIRK